MTAGLPSVCSPFIGWPIVRPRGRSGARIRPWRSGAFLRLLHRLRRTHRRVRRSRRVATRRRWTDVRYWASIAVAAAVATAIALLMFVPAVRLQQAEDFRRPFEGRLFSANWRTYFASSAYAHALDAAHHSALERNAVPRVHRGYWRRGGPRALDGSPDSTVNSSCMGLPRWRSGHRWVLTRVCALC